jgi:2-methylcitrate dehydratase PrpD
MNDGVPEADYTEELVSFVLETTDAEIPEDVRAAAARVTLDTIGCTIAGFDTEIGRTIASLKCEQGGAPEATLFVTGEHLPSASVAYVHAPLANALDFEETLMHTAHLSNLTVLPALAVGEKVHATGREVLSAICIGFDVAARIGLTLQTYRPSDTTIVYNGFSYGVFGTAAAAGRLLKLSNEQMRQAFGIAYDTTPIRPPMRPLGTTPMLKYTPYGTIAEAGVVATLLAARGFTGNSSVFDSRYEFWRGFGSQSFDWDRVVDGLGDRWLVAETSLKPYPVGRPLTLPIGLLRRIMDERSLEADDIESVVVRLSPTSANTGLSDRRSLPTKAHAAPFNLFYGLSAAALRVPPGPRWHAAETLADPRIARFADRIKAAVDPKWAPVISEQLRADGYFRRMPTEVRVLALGQEFTAYGEYAEGDPWDPTTRMSDDTLITKFRGLATTALGTKVEPAIAATLGLDEIEDISGYLHKLVG